MAKKEKDSEKEDPKEQETSGAVAPEEIKTTKFKYSGNTINNFSWGERTYQLHPGMEYELPSDAPQVKRMVAQKLLRKV